MMKMYVFMWMIILFYLHSSYAQQKATFQDFDLDLSTSLIDVDQVFKGGPPKDGIPALHTPSFITQKEATIPKEIRGIFVDIEGDQRFYPYSIIVWHELVNDSVGGKPILISYCPLCGSAVVYNRKVEDELLSFGVSGLLYQSNVLMYDSQTESLWSQAEHRAVIGSMAGKSLTILPSQLLTYQEIKRHYPKAKILSTETGFQRDYSRFPYGDYEENPTLIFPVLKEDGRFHPKKMMLAFTYKNQFFAINPDLFPTTKMSKKIGEYEIDFIPTKTTVEIYVNEEPVPTYWQMWFSWYAHHGKGGIVIEE